MEERFWAANGGFGLWHPTCLASAWRLTILLGMKSLWSIITCPMGIHSFCFVLNSSLFLLFFPHTKDWYSEEMQFLWPFFSTWTFRWPESRNCWGIFFISYKCGWWDVLVLFSPKKRNPWLYILISQKNYRALQIR